MHLFAEETTSFAGASDLIVYLDNLYDEWKYPQRATTQRTFKETREVQTRGAAAHLNSKEKVRTVDELYAARGELATFMLHVEYRQNASWQGHVIWLEEEKLRSFQSVLELLRLMDRALVTMKKEDAQ